MNRLAIVALSILAGAGCSKNGESRTPDDVSYGSTHQAGESESAFEVAWEGFTEGIEKVGEAGEWTFERMADGGIAVWHGTKKVAGKGGQEFNDAAVLSSVKSRLAAAEGAPADIDVDVDEGTVELRGRVDSRREAARAVQVALNTKGVDQVVSYLTW